MSANTRSSAEVPSAASPADDPHQIAMDWVRRMHECPLDDLQQAALDTWLRADVAHLQAWEDAQRLWLLAGLVPARGNTGDSDDSDD